MRSKSRLLCTLTNEASSWRVYSARCSGLKYSLKVGPGAAGGTTAEGVTRLERAARLLFFLGGELSMLGAEAGATATGVGANGGGVLDTYLRQPLSNMPVLASNTDVKRFKRQHQAMREWENASENSCPSQPLSRNLLFPRAVALPGTPSINLSHYLTAL